MNGLIKQTGNPKVFAERVIEKIKHDDCRDLLPLINGQSEYFNDTEYFYAKCIYQSRQFGKIMSSEYGPIVFAPLGRNGGPPLIPSQKVYVQVEHDGKAEERGIFINFLPANGRFEIVDVDFIFGKVR